MNKTIFIAAMLAVTTVLAAGLTVLPSSVQEAQANPCSLEGNPDYEVEDGDGATGSSTDIVTTNDERECTFIGNLEDAFDED